MDKLKLLQDGLQLMVMGMGMVYVFLIFMIFSMKLLRRALEPYAGLLEPPKQEIKKPAAADDSALAAAAVAAVEMSRR